MRELAETKSWAFPPNRSKWRTPGRGLQAASCPLFQREQLLSRVHFLFEPLADGVRAFTLEASTLELRAAPAASYSLLVVDEAHHLYPDDDARTRIEAHVGKGTSRLLTTRPITAVSDLENTLPSVMVVKSSTTPATPEFVRRHRDAMFYGLTPV